ncbi:hypothetical protein FNO01nite_08370 [Flavobacterium noncentrifugens]|uniref:Uncharacterized protein n=1 Tax=Flavobacterium noncentrifugens TaxID=1128970 RepID=A0A1G8TBM4_9FLAO|nr:hypothetical protein [Flavobacterium noncentrifugens]GEP50165.1 hypothetical protein FNO01nite_08370 [Flavobacterium noncentrifugens]SDJ38976.1 hypothetical protein SAMN04487935_0911 [Flavobacterium noncentrifugens]
MFVKTWAIFQGEDIAATGNRSIEATLKIRQKDTFALMPLRRDPFLNSTVNSGKAPIRHAVAIKTIKKAEVPKNVLPFPQVNYYGYIKSNQQQKELVMLKVDDKLVRLRTGESESGILKSDKIFR